MKAILFHKTGSVGQLQIEEIEKPGALQPSEVRLKFLAGSLNHLDLWVLKGLPRVKYSFPHRCGADLSGEIIESRSPKFKVGESVLLYPAESSGRNSDGTSSPENLCDDFRIRGENAPGVFAEEVTALDRYLVARPKHLSAAEAAALPLVYVTAWQMVIEKAAIKSHDLDRDPIVVHGAGSGVSQAILELLLSFGAKKVATTSRNREKLKPWDERGISTFISGDRTEDELKVWAGPRRVATIFDHIGQSFFEMNIRLLRRGGKFVTCGATSGPDGKLDLRHLYFRQLQLLGSTMGSLKHFEDVINWIADKKIRPQISHEFNLTEIEQVREAYRSLELGAQSGKIVLLGA